MKAVKTAAACEERANRLCCYCKFSPEIFKDNLDFLDLESSLINKKAFYTSDQSDPPSTAQPHGLVLSCISWLAHTQAWL